MGVEHARRKSPRSTLEECCASTSYKSVSCEAEYKLGRLLGDGSQGAVYHATRRSTGEEVALKVVDIPAGEREASVMRNVEEEILALRGCSHRSVLGLIDVFAIDSPRPGVVGTVYIVTDLSLGGDLLAAVEHRPYKEADAKVVMAQLCSAVRHLHERRVIHCDIKLENVLLDSRTSGVKLADMGMCRRTVERGQGMSRRGLAGSVLYIQPEQLAGDGVYNEKVDIWSLGVLLYIMLCGHAPFNGPSEDAVFRKIQLGEFSWDWRFEAVSGEVKDLIRGMLEVDPAKRPAIEAVIEHPWLKEASRLWEEHSAKK